MDVGLWTAQFDFQSASNVAAAAQKIEKLGYRSLWVGENVGREPFTQAGMLLAATDHLVVATGVINIWARDPLATLAAQFTLAEAYPGRFILGLGVSHRLLVENVRGGQYGRPLNAMRSYLDAMDQLRPRYRAVRPDTAPRVLAALGPSMLALAAELADGAHTYLVPPRHTAEARRALRPDQILVVEQAVVLEPDPSVARAVARQHVRRYLPLVNYTDNLRRLGFDDQDLSGEGSDRLVDSLVAWGEMSEIAARVHEHHEAGASTVCIQALEADPRALPLTSWQRLADAVNGR